MLTEIKFHRLNGSTCVGGAGCSLAVMSLGIGPENDPYCG